MGRTTALVAGGLMMGSGLIAPAAPAASSSDTVTSFLYDADSGKGVVVVTQGVSGTELAFNLFGLRPNSKYRMVVSSKGCASTQGTIISRTFRTTSRGSSWDPVAVDSTASPRSARIVRASTGKTVLCSSRGRVSTTGPKITGATPGVLAVSQGAQTWRVSLSIGGLDSGAAYRIVALDGGCSTGAPVLKRSSFRSDPNGFALVDRKMAPVAGKSIGAIRVVQRSDNEVVFCKAV